MQKQNDYVTPEQAAKQIEKQNQDFVTAEQAAEFFTKPLYKSEEGVSSR